MNNDEIRNSFNRLFGYLDQAKESHQPKLITKEVGIIISIAMGIANVKGMPNIAYQELVKFPGDVFGIALNIDEDKVGIVLLDQHSHIKAGDEVERTYRTMDVGVSYSLLGRVIDPLGRSLDNKGTIRTFSRLPIERPAPQIVSRLPVTEPLQTGITAIDALIPIGKGQRELILGDRQTGKSNIALNTVINQRDKNVICVYCAIGLHTSFIAKAMNLLKEHRALNHTVMVVTEGSDAPGLRFIAPYAATSIAEYFMEQGRDVLIVYDDLTHHARSYRELSLLLRRPPGREAYPGDIFYVHSRLLERATHLDESLGGGSLTALPIIETETEDISSYIPTNLISITDGQIYLSSNLFSNGILPAIDVNKSISRVGGKAQLPIYKQILGDLKLNYAQFEELETFTRFGAKLDKEAIKIIEHGKRIRLCLKQKEIDPISIPAQLLILLALTRNLFDKIPLDKVEEGAKILINTATDIIPRDISLLFDTKGTLNDEQIQKLTTIVEKILDNLLYSRPTFL